MIGMTEYIVSDKGMTDKHRFTDCAFYSSCLNEADRNGWDGYTCQNCDTYLEEKGA